MIKSRTFRSYFLLPKSEDRCSKSEFLHGKGSQGFQYWCGGTSRGGDVDPIHSEDDCELTKNPTIDRPIRTGLESAKMFSVEVSCGDW